MEMFERLHCGCTLVDGDFFTYSAGCKKGCANREPELYKKGLPSKDGLYPWVTINYSYPSLDFIFTDHEGRQIKPSSPYSVDFFMSRNELADTIAHTQEKCWFTIGHRDALYLIWMELFKEDNQSIFKLDRHLSFSRAKKMLLNKTC